MATLAQIYSIEENVSAAWKTLLVAAFASAGQTCQVLSPDVDDDTQSSEAKVPRVEISVEDTGNTDHLRSVSGSLSYFDEWRLSVRLRLVTDRVQGNATHKSLRATCRTVAHTTTRAAFETALGYYQCYLVRGTGNSYTVDDEDKLDVTELTFETVVRVLDTAWP
jgi:hypothetical protein